MAVLQPYYNEDPEIVEAGIDEAGRGPMFGRVYVAAVVLPKDTDKEVYDHSIMKDSKRFHSRRRIREVYDYIKENAVSYCVAYEEAESIDLINIRQAVLQGMHNSIDGLTSRPNLLLVDGNDFKPYIKFKDDVWEQTQHICIKGGDNKYTSIAAASILAKVERDEWIDKMCDENPELDEIYGIRSNKGYGSKNHLEAIAKNGISKWHRRSYGICKNFQ